MFKKSIGELAFLSGLLFAVLLPTSAGAAQDTFGCRSSAVRLGLPLGVVEEPIVANAQDNPCASDSQTVLSFTNALGISTGSLVAKTSSEKAPMYAKAKVDGLNLANVLGLVDLTAKSIRSSANIVISRNGNRCTLRGHSTITGLSALGQDIGSLSTPLDLDVKVLGLVVAKLHLNATLGGLNPTMGKPDPTKIIQRAVWLEVTDPVLKDTLVDVIAGEAASNAKCG